MANGYASNIPVENAAPEPELLAPGVCIICKRREAEPGGAFCAKCSSAGGI